MEKQSLYEYADHRDFLRSYLDKKNTPGGLRGLARRAGFKSPGHLAMVVSGERKLTLRSAELLAQAFRLRGRQRSLMLAYAKVDSARSAREKTAAQEEILRLKSSRPQHEITAKQYAFLAVWYYPVIFGLIHQKGSSQDPVWLARRVGRKVSAEAVTKTLSDLQDLNLIKKDESGRWHPVHSALTTPEDVQAAAVAQYHRNSLRLAEQALELPLAAREFNGLTVSVPDQLMPALKDKIRQFRTELNEWLAVENAPGEVFQLNIHLFPLTKTPERIS